MNDFITLFNIVRNNEDYFFSAPNINGLNEENANKKLKMRKLFQLTFKKLLIGIHLESINKLLEKEQKENNKNFFLRYEISFNEQFRKLMKIEQKKSQPNLTLPELKGDMPKQKKDDYINNYDYYMNSLFPKKKTFLKLINNNDSEYLKLRNKYKNYKINRKTPNIFTSSIGLNTQRKSFITNNKDNKIKSNSFHEKNKL